MKETIFFNKEQVKLIEMYNIVHKTYFKYGVYIIAFLSSLVFFLIFLKIPLIKNFSIKGVVDIEDTKQKVGNQNNSDLFTIKSVPNLRTIVLMGRILVSNNLVTSEDNVLAIGKVFVLPRLVNISEQKLKNYYAFDTSFYNKGKLESFFKDILLYPIVHLPFKSQQNSIRLGIKRGIKADFNIECMDQFSKNSIICKHYIDNFLSTFYYYNLDNHYAELQVIMHQLGQSPSYSKQICKGINKMLDLGAETDEMLKNMMYTCGEEDRKDYLVKNYFKDTQRGLNIGFITSSVSSNTELNYYKLISTQQLLVKQMNSEEPISSLLGSYLEFVKELMIEDGKQKGKNIFSDFYKQLTYRFNTEIIVPALNNENYNISKDQKNALLTDILVINNGSKVLGFEGLKLIEDNLANLEEEYVEDGPMDLRKLFKDSFLPPQFSLLTSSVKENNAILEIKGVDKKTGFEILASLSYENNGLYVHSIFISGQPELTDYINLFIKDDRYAFSRILGIIEENREIGSWIEETVDFCELLEEKYGEDLLECNPTTLILSNKDQVKYTFGLQNEELVSVEISDKILENIIVANINFSDIKKANTRQTINDIYLYQLTDQEGEFGMKTSLQILDYFKKFLNIEPNDIVHDYGITRVYFSVKGVKFIARYDVIKNELSQIGFDVGTRKDGVIIKNFTLLLSPLNAEKINSFLFDPLEAIREVNPTIIYKYFKTGSVLLPPDQR